MEKNEKAGARYEVRGKVALITLDNPPVNGMSHPVRAAMLEEVQRGWGEHGSAGTFRAAQITSRLRPERALELITELAERARELEEPDVEPLIITTVFHPPTNG